MTIRYACVREGAIIAGPGPWQTFAFWTDPDTGDVMQWTAKTVAEREALGWAEVAQINKPGDMGAVKDVSVAASVSSGAPVETWSWTAKTDAERAAGMSMGAPDFFDALWPVLETKGFSPTAPLRAWLVAHIAAITDADMAAALSVTEEAAAAQKRDAINRIDAASEFDRADPRLDQFAALYSITPTEIDLLFIGA